MISSLRASVLATLYFLLVSNAGAATVPDSTKSDSVANFNRAVKYFNAAKYRGALKIFEELAHGRSDPILDYCAGVCSYETGDYKSALNLLSILGPRDSLYSMASYYKAETMIALQNPAAAVVYLKNSLSKDSSYAPAGIELVKTLCNLEWYEDAEEFVTKRNEETEVMALCQCLLSASKYDDAYPILVELVTEDSTNASAKIMLAETYYGTQKYELAAKEYSSILEAFGQSPLVIRKLSLCYGHMGGTENLETAANLMKRYFKLAADSSFNDLENIGTWYFDLSNFGLAEFYFQSALNRDSLNASGYFNLGLALLKLDKVEKAADNLSHAYSLSMRNVKFSLSILKSLAAAELRMKNYRQAIDEYKRTVELDPDDGEAVYGLGLAYDQLKNMNAALYWYRKFIAMIPDHGLNHSFGEYAKRRLKEIEGRNGH